VVGGLAAKQVMVSNVEYWKDGQGAVDRIRASKRRFQIWTDAIWRSGEPVKLAAYEAPSGGVDRPPTHGLSNTPTYTSYQEAKR